MQVYLQGTKLDAAVASEVMGLNVIGEATIVNANGESVYFDEPPENWMCPARFGPVYQSGEDLWADDDEVEKLNGVSQYALSGVPQYHRNRAACEAVLQKIDELKLRAEFCRCFDQMTAKIADWADLHAATWRLINVSPEKICQAAVAAVRMAKAQ